jgi:ferredoxin
MAEATQKLHETDEEFKARLMAADAERARLAAENLDMQAVMQTGQGRLVCRDCGRCWGRCAGVMGGGPVRR